MVVDKENGKIDGDLFNWSFATQTESFAKFNQYKNNFDGSPPQKTATHIAILRFLVSSISWVTMCLFCKDQEIFAQF